MELKLNIYQKLHEARKYIKTCEEKKAGFNDYSKYEYYTPEQISSLVFRASEQFGLLNIFNLKRNELGIFGELKVFDAETGESITFEMASAIPEIKATNAAQQLGGAVTYTERYLLMVAFDIKDNNLDPDNDNGTQEKKKAAPKPQPKTDKEPEEWLNKWMDKDKTKENPLYWKLVNKAKSQGKTIKDLRLYFKINKDVAAELEHDLKN